MTLRSRRILFYLLAAAFLISGIAVIFYSNGWRLDPGTFSINKLGAIYLKEIPENAAVSAEKSDFYFESGILNSGIYIANLFPKIYRLKISKPGYRDWHKELEVKPSLVTEVPPIILIPKKFDFQAASAKKSADFNLRDKNSAAAEKTALAKFNSEMPLSLKEKFGEIRQAEHSPSGNFISILNRQNELFLANKNYSEIELIADNALLFSFSPNGKKLAFTTDKKEMVIHNLNPGDGKLAERAAILNIGAAEDSEFAWHKNSEYLFIKYPNGLYLLEGNNLPPINFQLIDSGIKKFQYLPEKNLIYLLKENSLYSLELR